ncbi:MAG TPA: hypothetical protein VGP72_30730 [Planctomycetota bacterium]|jgi:hypothetical protein
MSGRARLSRILSLVVAAGSLLALAASFLIPLYLDSYRTTAWRVNPRFSTSAERDELLGQAQLLGDAPFASIYETAGQEPVSCYLPPHGTFAHGLITLVARVLSVQGPVAAHDDFVTPSAALAGPQPGWIDTRSAYPVQVSAVAFFMYWMRIAGAVGIVVGLAGAYLLRRKANG